MKQKFSENVLNKTLQLVIKVLTNIPNWFIGYGTLLGIVRNNSCIDNDDDVDIVCDIAFMSLIKTLFIKNGFSVINNPTFLQFRKEGYSAIDFYCCEINNGTYIDKHENVIWTKCYPLQQQKWKDVMLYLPNNATTKLLLRYGKTWEIPEQTKGLRTDRTILQYL